MSKFLLRSSMFRVSGVLLGSLLLGLFGNFLHPRKLSLFEPVYSKAEISNGQCSAHSLQPLRWSELSVDDAILLYQQQPQMVVLDLRSSLEYAQGHIPKAIHLPCHGEKGKSILSNLAKDTTLLLYDADGNSLELRSAMEAALRYGIDTVYTLGGGFAAWEKHGSAESGVCKDCHLSI